MYKYKYLRLGIRCRRLPKTPGIPGVVQSVAPVAWGGSYRSVPRSLGAGWGWVIPPPPLSSPHSPAIILTCILHSARPSLAWATWLERAERAETLLAAGRRLGVVAEAFADFST